MIKFLHGHTLFRIQTAAAFFIAIAAVGRLPAIRKCNNAIDAMPANGRTIEFDTEKGKGMIFKIELPIN